jgi:hypothetical protein
VPETEAPEQGKRRRMQWVLVGTVVLAVAQAALGPIASAVAVGRECPVWGGRRPVRRGGRAEAGGGVARGRDAAAGELQNALARRFPE